MATKLNVTMRIKVLLMSLVLMMCASSIFADIDISQINVNDIQDQLPAELAKSNMTIEDAKTLLKDKCIQVAGEEQGEEAFNDIETSTMTLVECITGIVNYTAIQAEIDEASPKGELDAVFNKYCRKRPEALECVESFNAKLVPCLDKDEQENQVVFMRIVTSLLNFICHKGGDQIALFIAEKGPECLQSKREDITQCINSTFSNYVPKDGLENIKTLPKFVLGQKQCDEFMRVERCVVEKLETCDEITPANIIESMFRFVKNETICRTTSTLAAKQSSAMSAATASAGTARSFLLISSVFMVFYIITKRLQQA